MTLSLSQTQMMEAIGLSAGGIADELNNLMTVISVHNGMMLSACADRGTRCRRESGSGAVRPDPQDLRVQRGRRDAQRRSPGVRDRGRGARSRTAEVARRVFEPFFTTTAPGKGTGLGLAMVYAVAHRSGGFVTAANVPDGGPTFDAHLRRAEPRIEQIHQTSIVEVGPTRGMETILVVDDEPLLLRLITRQLQQLGYTCETAVDGADALRKALVLGDTVDLVLTDFRMPKMSGPEFVRSLHEEHPAIPVVFMTGVETTVELDEAALPPHAGVLHKPFTGAALGAMVRRTLDRNASTS